MTGVGREMLDELSTLWPRAAFARSKRLRRLKRHFDSRLPERFTAAEAARLLHLERRYFSKFFRGRVGMTFSQWVRRARIVEAVELLRDTDKPISVIASETGFQTARSLQRACREVLGKTPTQARDELRRKLDESGRYERGEQG